MEKSCSKLFILLFFFSLKLYSTNPEKGYKVILSDYGIIFKGVSIAASGGLTLKGWFYPAHNF